MAEEIELKLDVTACAINEHLATMCTHLGVNDMSRHHMVNRYYDTLSLDLKRKKIALRIREFDGQVIQTLKTAGTSKDGLHVRGEWEWPLQTPKLNANQLKSVEVWPKDVDVAALAPIFETNFVRQQALIMWGASEVEWVIDRGEVIADEKRIPICEMELELKSGDTCAIFEIESEMAQILLGNMCRSDISKAQRGYALLR